MRDGHAVQATKLAQISSAITAL